MNLKNAVLFAFVGTVLASALLLINLIEAVFNVLRGLIPPATLVPAFIYALAALSLATFFFVFHKGQS